MIYKIFAVIGVLTLLSAAAHAGSAPKELYDKSITVQFSESITGRSVADQTTQNWLGAGLMNIYISGAGRPFVRRTATTVGGAARSGFGAGNPTSSTAPGQSSSDRVDFQGRSVVVYSEFQSGARRIAVELDGAGCKATVINGRQAGKNITQKHYGRGQVEISSVEVLSVSCSIRDGNIFAQ